MAPDCLIAFGDAQNYGEHIEAVARVFEDSALSHPSRSRIASSISVNRKSKLSLRRPGPNERPRRDTLPRSRRARIT
jgi:hypothetical protein